MTEEEKNLSKVLYAEKKDRTGETFTSALKKRLEEVRDIGDTGYTREVVISVPKDIIESNGEARRFVKIAGEIKRDTKSNVGVAMEPMTIAKNEDENTTILDFVFSVTKETDITHIIKTHLS